MEGIGSQNLRSLNTYDYVPGGGDPGRVGGGTYTNPRGDGNRDPTIQDYENIFGPAARDIKIDLQRNKRHARWHLPDVLRGSNPYLADRVDGLITDTTSSPFTTIILPYKYIENVDQKIKWNAWSFDEGLASRVPYESAARTLTQTKRSYAGYTIRHGLAITMEHNFMMSDRGRENFKNQLQQVVGSIQYTNDLDVHIALITAQSYAKERAERYYTSSKTNHQVIREYIDLFGFMSKNPNAMDIMIEEAKAILRTWGASDPNFLLTNSKLTFQMTMIPEKTQYLTQGPDGMRKLRDGPNIASYRGLKIINSRSFSMEEGAPPRDVLRRRVRVAEYYRIPWEDGVQDRSYAFYDESKDAWQKFTWHELERMSMVGDIREMGDGASADWDDEDEYYEKRVTKMPTYGSKDPVDVFLKDDLFKHMTCGEVEGNIGDGYTVTGNLALNPWYALHGFEVFDNVGGRNVAGLQMPTADPALNAGAANNIHWIVPGVGGSVAPAVPHNYPPVGRRYFSTDSGSEYRFTVFDKYLRAFGYRGRKVTDKPDTAVRHIRVNGGACGADDDQREQCARGTRDVPIAAEAGYTVALNDAACNDALRGHPDYDDPSYKQARHNFHRWFMLYLQGKADHLPPLAREFFDNFNWQRFVTDPVGNRPTLASISNLLARLYHVDKDPISNTIPGPTGMAVATADLAGRSTAIEARLEAVQKERVELVVVRPNIEHNMLGIIMGRGGLEELGATFWGQTELSCYDDSMHGIWGMSYKYNEKAIVLNQKNLIRLWDVAYDGYNGGKDCTHVCWTDPEAVSRFKDDTYEMNKPYEGASMMVMKFVNIDSGDPWPSPIIFHDQGYKNSGATMSVDGENANFIKMDPFRVFNRSYYQNQYKNYIGLMPDFSKMHNTKTAGSASEENETQACALAFQGTMKIFPGGANPTQEISGSGHHGIDYVGVASVRSGKGMRMGPMQESSIVKIM